MKYPRSDLFDLLLFRQSSRVQNFDRLFDPGILSDLFEIIALIQLLIQSIECRLFQSLECLYLRLYLLIISNRLELLFVISWLILPFGWHVHGLKDL